MWKISEEEFPHVWDETDLNARGRAWCEGCDNHALDWCPVFEDGAPLYRDGMGPGDPVRCDND